MDYAITAVDPAAGYQIYGKGANAAEAIVDAGRNIAADDPNAAALRANLTVVSRAEAEERGVIPAGAPVIWHADLGHYHVEDHSAPASGTKPTGVVYR